MSVSQEKKITWPRASEDLWRVAETDDIEELARIRGSGAEINSRNQHGTTALMRAACRGNVRMVRALLEHGADPNLTRSDEFTALTLAAFFGHTEVVRILIAHGAETNVATRSGTSAYMWATARSFDEIAQFLERSGGGSTQTEAPATGTAFVQATQPAPSSTIGEQNLAASGGAVESLTSIQHKPLEATPVKVKTLKDPPEIWDLVHEAPRKFDARSAFVSRLKAMNMTLALSVLAGVLLVAVSAIGWLVLRGSQAGTVQAPAVSSRQAVTDNTEGAPANVEDASPSSLSAPAVPDTEASFADHAARSHHVNPETDGVEGESEPPVSTPVALAASENDRRTARKPRVSPPRKNSSPTIATNATAQTPDGDEVEKSARAVARPQFELRPPSRVSPKSQTGPTLSPQLIAPTKGSASKPKVIQWP